MAINANPNFGGTTVAFNPTGNPIAVGDNTGLGGTLDSIIDLIRGVNGSSIDRSRVGAAAADPFSGERGGYQDMLRSLMTDPNLFKADPGYEFAKSQGQQAIESASNALYGTRRTGSLAPELAKFTEGYAAQNYDNRINQLMQMAGVNAGSPAVAGQILGQGYANNDRDLASGVGGVAGLIANALGLTGTGAQQLIQALTKAFGGSGGTDMGPTMPTSPTGDTTLWGGNGYPDPGNGTYGPQLDTSWADGGFPDWTNGFDLSDFSSDLGNFVGAGMGP